VRNARARASPTVVTTTPPVNLVARSLYILYSKWISRRRNATIQPTCIYVYTTRCFGDGDLPPPTPTVCTSISVYCRYARDRYIYIYGAPTTVVAMAREPCWLRPLSSPTLPSCGYIAPL